MSSDVTGFTTGGFFRRSQSQIYDDYKTAASGVYEEINMGPGSFGYQISKIVGLREREVELLLESMVSGLSVDFAYGDFLERMAIDRGLEKKGPQKAGGYITLTFDSIGQGDTPINLLDTYYTTPDGKIYYRSVSGLSQFIYHYIPVTRSVLSFDGFPTPFVNIEGTGYTDSNQDGSGTAYDPVFNAETQIIDWSSATSYPATGATYYVGISGYEVKVKDDITSNVAGTGYNIGTNTINKWHGNSTLPTDATVNNSYDITGGADWEDDDNLRARVKNTTNRTFTTTNIRSNVENINGVRAAYVYQDIGIDRTSISGNFDSEKTDFSNGVNITGIYSGADRADMVSGNAYGQLFYPGNGIMGLKQVLFYGRRIGNPPPMVIGLRIPPSDDYETSGVFDTYDIQPPAGDWQDMKIPMSFLDLDSSIQYSLDFWCSEKSGASGTTYWDNNYWQIATGQESGDLGDGDTYTGLLRLGGSLISDGVNSVFRSYYPAAAINIDVAIKDGYNFDEIEEEIDNKLDWVDGSGYMPIGIKYDINEATPVYIYYSVTSYLENNTNLASTKDRVDINIESYVENLLPGKNVVYSEIYKTIMVDTKIWRIDDLEVWESGGIHSSGQDIKISEREVAVFGGSTVNQG